MQKAKILILLWVSVFLLFLLLSKKSGIYGDAISAYKNARTWISTGNPGGLNNASVGPRLNNSLNNKFDLRLPLLYVVQCIPAVWLDYWLESNGVTFYDFRGPLQAVFPGGLSACLVVVMALLFLELGASFGFAVGLALLGLFATPLTHYGRSYYGETLQTFLLTLFLYLWVKGRYSKSMGYPILLGTLAGLMINAKMTLGIVFPFFLVGFFFGRQNLHFNFKWITLATLSFAPWFAIMLFYNYLRFGSIFGHGYVLGPDAFVLFKGSITNGFYGQTLGTGKGLMFFAPILILSVYLFRRFFSKRQTLASELFGIVFAFLIFHSIFWAWHAGWCWGPRYLVPIIPAMMMPLVYLDFSNLMEKLSLICFGACGLCFCIGDLLQSLRLL